ncbi:hypothetical protein E2C01_071480 [Portunus trituberculatus]|uniref:Uncharacterized protein n=1 Tax=Portunus trituberculatus TaxID=210409 RepID=A0A5B7HVG6_PORTR|nr:hypothetical protein [Portunus trituberculatus]
MTTRRRQAVHGVMMAPLCSRGPQTYAPPEGTNESDNEHARDRRSGRCETTPRITNHNKIQD